MTARRMAALLDGLVLLGLGGFVARLLATNTYWMYLNPKFAPVSAVAAGMLILLGVLALFRRDAVFRPVRSALFLGFLCMCLLGRPEDLYQVNGSLTMSGPAAEDDAPAPSRLTMDGREYVKINTGELFNICRKDKAAALPGNWVMRGVAVRGKALEKYGQFGLFRVSVYCCFADAVAVGYRVKGTIPPGVSGGDWLQVFGHLEPSQADKQIRELKVKNIPVTMMDSDYVFVADKIVPIEQDENETMFMYEWREKEPFAY